MPKDQDIIAPENFRHDQLFKKSMDNPMVREEFLRAYLDPKIGSMLDYSSLKVESNSFIEETLRDSYCDVMLSANFNNRKGYLYVLAENQSSPDKLMALRLFKYMLSICDRHLAENNDSKTLPIVYPLV